MSDSKMSDLMLKRRSAFDGLNPIRVEGAVTVTSLPSATRFSFRGDAKAASACSKAFGATLPTQLMKAESVDGRTAISLGPDEWLLIAPDGEVDRLETAIKNALGDHHHSLVDISHRNTAFTVSGPKAETLLASGCLLDLHPSAFPVGMATRTIYSKADIVLWRPHDTSFRVELWRSFVPFVWGLLEEASHEL